MRAVLCRVGHVLRTANACRDDLGRDAVNVKNGGNVLDHGNTVVGKNVVVGGNAFITKSVPDYTKIIVKSPEMIFKNPKAPNEKWEI